MKTTEITVEKYYEPSSLRELVTILHVAEANGKQVHPVGAGYSFEDLAATEDWMIDLSKIAGVIPNLVNSANRSRVLSDDWVQELARNGNDARRLVHVKAGTRLFDLCQILDSKKLALPTMGGALGQHVVGAFSTSTHGSDVSLPPLCDLIHAVHLVTVGGQEMWIESRSRPLTKDDNKLLTMLRSGAEQDRACHDLQIVRDDALLNAVVVAMGRFGVIYSVVLEVTTRFRLAEYSQELRWDVVNNALRRGIGADNLLASLERRLQAPPNDLGVVRGDQYRYLDIILGTRDKEKCWVRRRWKTTATPDRNIKLTENLLCHPGVAHAILHMVSAALDLHAPLVFAVPFVGLVEGPLVVARSSELKGMALNPHITGGEALAAALNAIWSSMVLDIVGDLPALVDKISNMQIEGTIFPHESRAKGRRGRNWVVSAGSEDPENLGDCYQGNSIEIIFGVDTDDYIRFINAVLDRMGSFKRQSGYIAVRFSRRSRALLSMHNVGSDIACSIEITSLRGLDDNDEWMKWIERTAISMGGRPHWGQQNNLDGSQVKQLYGENLRQWQTRLHSIVGQSATFSNNYTRQRGLEPLAVPDPTMKLLYRWWSSSRLDNFLTSDPRWSGRVGEKKDGYRLSLIEGQVFDPRQPQPSGTIPLFSWWNGDREDNFISSSSSWSMPLRRISWNGETVSNGPIKDGYRLYRLEGFIYDPKRPQPPNTKPLFSWWNPDRRDNFATTQTAWGMPLNEIEWNGEHIANGPFRDGYRLYRLEGFVVR
jgi:hypothetical protein